MTRNGMKSNGLCTRIIETVAKREQTDPEELQTLYDVINPDVLNRLFRPKMDETERSGRVEFPYNDYMVIIDFDDKPEITLKE
ncbi:HalOD1 output domain-containing protein [Natrinema sp. DC36]|uniref:HalOD1 output domain-containing protein n=1 Tax=Natrinema sp. DC36 TaxID=2878680 RepID=UPI001CF04187|nr:HalOD1 output domain-containing protein [Natrinema sp. DC36]